MASIGIDLGTTNTVAAFYDGKKIKVLTNNSSEVLTPSVVGYRSPKKTKEGQILVGRPALNNAALAPRDTIYSIKRLMGAIWGDEKVEETRTKVSYEIVKTSAETDHGVRILMNGTEYSPVDISSMILKEIKESASKRLGEEVTHAVITVPAYFNERQRVATREAGVQAGLIVKMIMSEPVAAALAFGLDAAKDEGRRVLVFDLGGGTFDISIIQMFGNQFQVLYHGGDNWLGGDDFDAEVTKLVVQAVVAEEGFDPSGDLEFQAKVMSKAREAKETLSTSDEYEIVINPAGRTPDGEPFSLDVSISRSEFEASIMGYVDKCIELTRKAMRDQEFSEDDLSDILLVGGSTAVPLVQNRLRQAFSTVKVRSDVNPMECVAVGAAIMATKFKGIECPECFEDDQVDEDKRQHTINEVDASVCRKCGTGLATAKIASEVGYHDITSMDLGVRAVKGDNLDTFVPIIKKGTAFPLDEPKCQTFYTAEDNQQLIRIPVFEGTHALATQNEQQGIVEWQLPEGLPINTSIEVSFNFDRDRTLTVNIRVMGRQGLSHTAVLKRGLAPEIVETRDFEEADWREEAEGLVPAGEHFQQHYGEYLRAEARGKLDEALDKLKKAINANDEMPGRRAAQEVYTIMVGTGGVASQLYLASRVVEGAPPEVAAEIHQHSEELRNAYLTNAEDTNLRQLVGALKTRVARQMQTQMSEQVVGEKVDYESLLRFKA